MYATKVGDDLRHSLEAEVKALSATGVETDSSGNNRCPSCPFRAWPPSQSLSRLPSAGPCHWNARAVAAAPLLMEPLCEGSRQSLAGTGTGPDFFCSGGQFFAKVLEGPMHHLPQPSGVGTGSSSFDYDM